MQNAGRDESIENMKHIENRFKRQFERKHWMKKEDEKGRQNREVKRQDDEQGKQQEGHEKKEIKHKN